MPIRLTGSGGGPVLRLEGEVGLKSAHELRRVLVQALASGRNVTVSLEQTSEMDLSTVQLLLAAGRAAARAQHSMTLTGSVPAPVRDCFDTLGVDPFASTEGDACPK